MQKSFQVLEALVMTVLNEHPEMVDCQIRYSAQA
jgi:hypothetical protein